MAYFWRFVCFSSRFVGVWLKHISLATVTSKFNVKQRLWFYIQIIYARMFIFIQKSTCGSVWKYYISELEHSHSVKRGEVVLGVSDLYRSRKHNCFDNHLHYCLLKRESWCYDLMILLGNFEVCDGHEHVHMYSCHAFRKFLISSCKATKRFIFSIPHLI